MDIDNADLVFEVARRTLHNLDFVKATAVGQDDANPTVFEVTHVVNSLLGLLVLPRELWLDKQPDEPLSSLYAAGWPKPQFEVNTAQCVTMKQLVTLLRHSIAHGNIEFIAAPHPRGASIGGIRLWNHPDGSAKKRPVNFRVRYGVADVERFVRLLVDRMLRSRRRVLAHPVVESLVEKVA